MGISSSQMLLGLLPQDPINLATLEHLPHTYAFNLSLLVSPLASRPQLCPLVLSVLPSSTSSFWYPISQCLGAMGAGW